MFFGNIDPFFLASPSIQVDNSTIDPFFQASQPDVIDTVTVIGAGSGTIDGNANVVPISTAPAPLSNAPINGVTPAPVVNITALPNTPAINAAPLALAMGLGAIGLLILTNR